MWLKEKLNQINSANIKKELEEVKKDNERLYAGHRGLEEEINFLKYRIQTLDELHESVVMKTWPHDGSFKNCICEYPFIRAEILPRGEVYTCCSAYVKHNYYIGNIYEAEDFDSIWNSDKAKKLRYAVSEGNFEYCQKHCKFLHMPVEKLSNALGGVPVRIKRENESYACWQECRVDTAPLYIALSCDETCNLYCPTCRSNVRVLNKEESDKLYDRLMKIVRPMMKDCRILGGLGTGELFASSAISRFYKTLTAEEFPQLKLIITSNLQLLTKEKWAEFSNLLGFPKDFFVSMDGATKETYEHNRAGANWEKMMENLGYLCSLRKASNAHLEHIGLNFVVQENNFREIPQFVSMAKQLGVDAVWFQKFTNWGTFTENEYRQKNVFDPQNEYYAEAMDILQNAIKEKGIEIVQNII